MPRSRESRPQSLLLIGQKRANQSLQLPGRRCVLGAATARRSGWRRPVLATAPTIHARAGDRRRGPQLSSTVRPDQNSVESVEDFKKAICDPDLAKPRRRVCSTLAKQLSACGERLWAFGFAPRDFRTAISIVLQFGGSLATGAGALAAYDNWYAASALVRQLVEIQYLLRLFSLDPNEALAWLTATQQELRTVFSPSRMRQRLPEGQFRHQEYRSHCEIGGHPNPGAHYLLPARIAKQHLPPFGTNEVFWVDLAQHLVRIWRDVAALPYHHPQANLAVISQYTEAVDSAISSWEAIDPCAPPPSDSLLAKLAAPHDSA